MNFKDRYAWTHTHTHTYTSVSWLTTPAEAGTQDVICVCHIAQLRHLGLNHHLQPPGFTFVEAEWEAAMPGLEPALWCRTSVLSCLFCSFFFFIILIRGLSVLFLKKCIWGTVYFKKITHVPSAVLFNKTVQFYSPWHTVSVFPSPLLPHLQFSPDLTPAVNTQERRYHFIDLVFFPPGHFIQMESYNMWSLWFSIVL